MSIKAGASRPILYLAAAAVTVLLMIMLYAAMGGLGWGAPKKVSRESYRLGTIVRITVYGDDSEKLSNAVALSMKEIERLENLLSVTRIDGAKVEVVKTPTVLDELIDSVLMKFSKKYPNQKVITQIPEEFVDIPMDSLLIEQVLLNLLENAVFHAKGMTELTLSVSLVGDKAVFEVADNGCGIPEDALQKIFTGSYEKSAAPVDGTRSNMGIGLSVCAAIVKAHGSEITAENRKGGGAVFRFALERGGEDDGQ